MSVGGLWQGRAMVVARDAPGGLSGSLSGNPYNDPATTSEHISEQNLRKCVS